MIAADQAAGRIHEPGVGTAAVVEIGRREVMPGTGAGRAREHRAWTSSLKLIGQSSTPADGVKHRIRGGFEVRGSRFSKLRILSFEP